MPPSRLQAFATVFTITDIGQSLAWYVERLGFGEHFRLGDPPSYAIIERDCVSLHLMPSHRQPAALGQSSIYVFAADVDALHAELLARDCPVEKAPEDYDYGMREFSVLDPDGNRITFGQESKAP